jgi:hypothetical protein
VVSPIIGGTTYFAIAHSTNLRKSPVSRLLAAFLGYD